MNIQLHPKLQADCFLLGNTEFCSLLLHKNALLPWFILVPNTSKNELHKLSTEQQNLVQNSTNQIAHFTEQHFKTDKLNIATIGNIVPQLHIHIIGRFIEDFCWPNPVWGKTESRQYKDADVATLQQILLDKKIIQLID